jgi:beta-lactamase regulating signal transducer with metallopeptidase domain
VDAVLNWVLQGAVVAIAAAVLLRMVDGSRTRVRYAALCVALASVLILPIVPLLLVPASALTSGDAVSQADLSVVAIPAAWWMSTRVMVALWTLWVVLYAARLGRAAMALRRAKRACRPLPDGVEQRLASWSDIRTRGRATRLVLSTRIRFAAVLGCRYPVIAIAPRLLDKVRHDDLDRIVVHEWAHVQRRDDIANVVQLLTRLAVGWHPAVWWLDRQLRLEREVACDDVAVAVTGSPKAYAACLVRLATLPDVTVPALPALAALAPSGLRRRVERILSARQDARQESGRAIVACVSALLIAIACAVGTQRFIEVEAAAAAGAVTYADRDGSVAAADPVTTVEREALGRAPSSTASAAALPSATRARRAILHQEAVVHQTAAVAPQTAPREPAANDSGTSRQEILPPLPSVAVAPHATWIPLARPSRSAAPAAPDAGADTPWEAAADTGVAVARGSQKAAVATAGLFTRVGKKIAGAF